ncbi:MAG TPA: histidine kinase dimerization/phospho-acceptor domain-containing protein, partial [Daejeonella sp.]|nr:histidine kinase dimerization/phospho-acceptor domain-containing protein [Daejeonella sp.]
MTANLKILILEDNQSDADLLQRELKKSGLIFTAEIVQTRVDFEKALHNFNPDLILSDYSLPSFDAVSAFNIKQNISPLIPFIIVSGVIGEENAVELIKNGVTDYTPKDKLFTLSTKISRALKDREEAKEKKAIAEKLKMQTAELIIANKELIIQNQEKEKRTVDLIVLTEALNVQKDELKRANEELHEKAQLLQQQEEKLIRTNEDLEKRVFERTCELENLNHELKDLNLSKDKFLSVISHDLRNPLTALMITSDKLSRDTENSKVGPLAKIIHRTSHKILDQLNELVDWAQMQREKTTFNSEKLHLVRGV